ncbi:RNA polymerase sigma factor [Polyangium spumosum]|nr:sigma-70 family RNA polymerase sigma factor [Polyangium spumosum]
MVTSTRCPDPILPLSDEVVPADPSRPPVRYPTAEELNAVVLPPPSEVFQQLYAREWQFVLRTVERYGVPARDADDIAQEVFAVALRRIADHDAASSARPWLFVIAMQLATNYRKLARHRMEPLASASTPEPFSDTLEAEAALLDGEEQALARELIGRMRPKLREVLVMHDLDEQPMAEIADKLGIPLKTAYARLKLARAEALRRGRALAASSLAVSTPRPLLTKDLLRVRDVLYAFTRRPAVAPRRPRLDKRRFMAPRSKAAKAWPSPMFIFPP